MLINTWSLLILGMNESDLPFYCRGATLTNYTAKSFFFLFDSTFKINEIINLCLSRLAEWNQVSQIIYYFTIEIFFNCYIIHSSRIPSYFFTIFQFSSLSGEYLKLLEKHNYPKLRYKYERIWLRRMKKVKKYKKKRCAQSWTDTVDRSKLKLIIKNQ